MSCNDTKTVISSCGKYELIISQGTITDKKISHCQVSKRDGTVICTVDRNYGQFHFSIVTKDKTDYLITGKNVGDQLLVNLSTGEAYELLSPLYFCWTEAALSPDGRTLMVTGCFWGGCYEKKFYDFTNPEQGWFELPIENHSTSKIYHIPDNEDKPAIFDPEGNIVVYLTDYYCKPIGKFLEDISTEEMDSLGIVYGSNLIENHPDLFPLVDTSIIKLRRQDNKMIVYDVWESEQEIFRRKETARLELEHKAKIAEFTNNDPLYLKYLELTAQYKLLCKESYGSAGSHWVSDFRKEETLLCVRLFDRASQPYTVDLSWAIDTGPIKLNIYKDGAEYETRIFKAHTTQNIEKAVDYAISLRDKPQEKE